MIIVGRSPPPGGTKGQWALATGSLVSIVKKEGKRDPVKHCFETKQLIGRKFQDAVVQADLKLWPFEVSACAGHKNMIEANYLGDKKMSHPEQNSSMRSFRHVELPTCGASDIWSFRHVEFPTCGASDMWSFQFIHCALCRHEGLVRSCSGGCRSEEC